MKTYTTRDNDRWDTISYKAYGHCQGMAALMAANEDVFAAYNHPAILPGGVLVSIPDLPDLPDSQLTTLPPWKVQ